MDNSNPLSGGNIVPNNPSINDVTLPPVIPPSPPVPIHKPSKHNILAFISIPVVLILLMVGLIANQKTTENRSKAAHPDDCQCINGVMTGDMCGWEGAQCFSDPTLPPPTSNPLDCVCIDGSPVGETCGWEPIDCSYTPPPTQPPPTSNPLDCVCIDGSPVGETCGWEPIDCSYTPPPTQPPPTDIPGSYCAGGGQPESIGQTGCCPLLEPDSSGICVPKPGVDLCVQRECPDGEHCNPGTGLCIQDPTPNPLTPTINYASITPFRYAPCFGTAGACGGEGGCAGGDRCVNGQCQPDDIDCPPDSVLSPTVAPKECNQSTIGVCGEAAGCSSGWSCQENGCIQDVDIYCPPDEPTPTTVVGQACGSKGTGGCGEEGDCPNGQICTATASGPHCADNEYCQNITPSPPLATSTLMPTYIPGDCNNSGGCGFNAGCDIGEKCGGVGKLVCYQDGSCTPNVQVPGQLPKIPVNVINNLTGVPDWQYYLYYKNLEYMMDNFGDPSLLRNIVFEPKLNNIFLSSEPLAYYFDKEIHIRAVGVASRTNAVHEYVHFLTDTVPGFQDDFNKAAGYNSVNPFGTGLTWITTQSPDDVLVESVKDNPVEQAAYVLQAYTDQHKSEKLKNEHPQLYDWARNQFKGKEAKQVQDEIYNGVVINSIPRYLVWLKRSINKYHDSLFSPVHASLSYASSTFYQFIPGQTSLNDVFEKLGSPVQAYSGNGKIIYWYLADDKKNLNTFIFKNQKLYFLTIHLGNDSTDKISDFGTSEFASNNNYREDTRTLINTSLGWAVTADPKDRVLVVQKYIPTTKNSFLTEWGSEFPDVATDATTTSPSVSPTPLANIKIAIPIPQTYLDVIYNSTISLDYQAFLNAIKNDYLKTGSPGFSTADIDNNGVIDIFDFNKFIQDRYSQ